MNLAHPFTWSFHRKPSPRRAAYSLREFVGAFLMVMNSTRTSR